MSERNQEIYSCPLFIWRIVNESSTHLDAHGAEERELVLGVVLEQRERHLALEVRPDPLHDGVPERAPRQHCQAKSCMYVGHR